MDAYVSKPIEAGERLATIEGLVPGAAGPGPETRGEERAAMVFDADALRARVAGDEELLRELIELFLDDCPRMLSEMQAAIADRNAEALRVAAHAFRGSVGNFSAAAVVEAARRLEMMGRTGALTGIEEAWATLDEETERFTLALAALGDQEAEGVKA